jgi:hypothetical protein
MSRSFNYKQSTQKHIHKIEEEAYSHYYHSYTMTCPPTPKRYTNTLLLTPREPTHYSTSIYTSHQMPSWFTSSPSSKPKNTSYAAHAAHVSMWRDIHGHVRTTREEYWDEYMHGERRYGRWCGLETVEEGGKEKRKLRKGGGLGVKMVDGRRGGKRDRVGIVVRRKG